MHRATVPRQQWVDGVPAGTVSFNQAKVGSPSRDVDDAGKSYSVQDGDAAADILIRHQAEIAGVHVPLEDREQSDDLLLVRGESSLDAMAKDDLQRTGASS